MNDTAIQLTKTVDLYDLISPTTALRKVGAREYAGACPKCGGKDRFHVNLDRGWFCRQCTGVEHFHDAIDFLTFYKGVDFKTAVRELSGKDPISPAEIERRYQERERLEAARAVEEQRKYEATRAELNTIPDWKTYNANLAAYPEGLDLWGKRGITPDWAAYYGLGYCPDRVYPCDDGQYHSASLTIPYWRCSFTPMDDGGGDDIKWELINLKHRLLCTDAPGGKYRPHLPGAGNHLFYTDPMVYKLFGDVLIVEGEIKAMVTWSMFWEYDNLAAPNLFVVGIPGASWKPEFIKEFEGVERLFICLDPDKAGREASKKLALAAGKERSYIIDLPEKIDDLILAGALDLDNMAWTMDHAKAVK